jgi:hypothetical protein
MFSLKKIEGKKKVLMVKWDSIEKHTKGKLLMVCGLWIQNASMQKMKLLMFSYQ